MGANTEMTRLDSIDKETLDALLGLLNCGTVPKVTSTDNGKVLMVVSGKWKAVAMPTELPEVDAEDDGKLLGVSSGAWAAVTAPTELPAVTAEDDDKVLTVVDGAWAAVNPNAEETEPEETTPGTE